MTTQHGRFEGTIHLSVFGIDSEDVPGVASMIIGRGGSNIKRLATTVPGGHIRLFNAGGSFNGVLCSTSACDTVLITGRSEEDVKRLAGLIKADVLTYLDPTRESSKPRLLVSCPKEAVGSVIKKSGIGLKSIENSAGDDCFIVHEHYNNHFVVTASTEVAVQRAKLGIESAIQRYEDGKVIHQRLEGGSKEYVDPHPIVELEDVRTLLKWDPKGNPEKERLVKALIREEMSKWEYADGTLVHQDYVVYDDDGTERILAGIDAVPSYAVDDELEERIYEEYVTRVKTQKPL